MPEWIKDILMAIGGGSVVLIGILTIFKQLFIKSFETGMETVFQKNMEKYRNQLSRSTRAYEMILDRDEVLRKNGFDFCRTCSAGARYKALL